MNYSDIFDQRGGMYHQAMTLYPHARRLEFEIPLAICQPKAHEIIVDIPSGGGYINEYLDDQTKLICLEPSQQFAAFCQLKKLAVFLYDQDQLPLNDSEVDVIISIAGIHHIENKKPLFKEMRRILKPNGRLCIADVQHGSNIALFLDDIVDRYTETGHRGLYLTDETLHDLNAVGFVDVKQQLLNYVWRFASEQDLVAYFKLLFGLVKATDNMVLIGIKQYLTVHETQSGLELEWQLLSFSVT